MDQVQRQSLKKITKHYDKHPVGNMNMEVSGIMLMLTEFLKCSKGILQHSYATYTAVSSQNDLVKIHLGFSSPQGKPGLPGLVLQVVCHFFLLNLVADLLG